MLRHALRRLLWIVPILIGVTLTSFALLSYVPDPAEDPAVLATLVPEQAKELRRSRFLDLPRFFNEHPRDVVIQVDAALARLVADGEKGQDGQEGQRVLVALGGAALPHLLPRLDALEPTARARVAVALFPIAERMGIKSGDATDPDQAVAFWNRFWTDRASDFRAPNARRAARRLALHATSARQADLLELDTFALEQIIAALDELASQPDSPDVGLDPPQLALRTEAIRRLVGAAAHATGRDDQLTEGANAAEALACEARWREWWLVHQADYTAYVGPSRFLAMLTDTQYARWAEKVVLLGYGRGTDGASILQKLQRRARPTLTITAGALLLAYTMALFLSVAGAVRSRNRLDIGVGVLSLALFVTPTALIAVWAHAAQPGLALSIVVLSLALVASPLGQGRTILREVARLDYMRTARAFGFGPIRIVLQHALRNALLPMVALFSVELPTALGGAFVVEKAFGIAGLGEETVHAVQTHDVAWLVGIAFLTAFIVTLTSIAADLAVAAIDPRLSLAALRHDRAEG